MQLIRFSQLLINLDDMEGQFALLFFVLARRHSRKGFEYPAKMGLVIEAGAIGNVGKRPFSGMHGLDRFHKFFIER